MASKAAAHFLQFRIQYSSLAFLYYDYALTFPAEVKYVWGKRFRLSTILYICCRYALVANVLYLLAKLEKLGATHVLCDVWYKIIGVISVLGRAAVIAALTGRTYAVYECNRLVLALLTALGLTCIILDLSNRRMCQGSGVRGRRRTELDTLLSILMVVFEFTAAILLTVRTMMEFRVGGTWKFNNGSFFAVVFKQGITYFAVVSIFTLAAVVLNFRAPAGSFFQRLPNAYTLPLSCTLIARFLLQLREWQDKSIVMTGDAGQGLSGQDQYPSTLTEMRANTLIDSMMLSDFGDGPLFTINSSQGESETDMETGRAIHGEDSSSERDCGGTTIGAERINLQDLSTERDDKNQKEAGN